MDTIQPMSIYNLKRVLEIEKASFKVDWTIDAFLYELLVNGRASYFTYKIKGVIVGYIGIWDLEDEIHITNLAIDRKYQKKGIGTKLINYILELNNHGINKIVGLEVRVSNVNAITLYEKLGFFKDSKLENYYKTEDGIRMIFKNGGENGY